MMKTYRFNIDGVAAGGQTWTTSGDIQCDFHDVFNIAMSHSFEQLTHGKAVYGKPGVGCRGPYDIRRVVIEAADA